jgi:hypothetical protein
VHDYLSHWEWDGTIERVHHVLYVTVREAAGREGEPDDSNYRQPDGEGGAKGRPTLDPPGYDTGKKIAGRTWLIILAGGTRPAGDTVRLRRIPR